MQVTNGAHTRRDEFCEVCGGDIEHDVRIVLRTESRKSHNAVFSREPYRVTVCTVCGAETDTRMNNV